MHIREATYIWVHSVHLTILTYYIHTHITYRCSMHSTVLTYIHPYIHTYGCIQCIQDSSHTHTHTYIHAYRWVDYSKKYGLGYSLSDGRYGVFFNDATKILLSWDQVCVRLCVCAYKRFLCKYVCVYIYIYIMHI